MNNIYTQQYTPKESEKKIKIIKDKNSFKLNKNGKSYHMLNNDFSLADFPVPSTAASSYEMIKKYQEEAEELQEKLKEALEELEMLKQEIKDLNDLLDQR